MNPQISKLATLTGHRDCVYVIESGEGSVFFTGSGDGMVVMWDINDPETGLVVAKFEHSVYSLKYLKERNQLLIGQNFQGVHLLDLASKKEVASTKITDASIFDIKVSKEFIFVGTGDGTLIVLDINDLTTISKMKLSEKSLRVIALHPDGKTLAVGFSDHSFKIIDLEKLKINLSIVGHTNSVFTLRYDAKGKHLLSAGRDAHLKVWDVEDGYTLKKDIVAHMFAINHIDYSPDYSLFATCSMDKSIKIWDSSEFRLLKIIDKARHTGHGTSVNKVLWSDFNNYLLSCSDDRTISIWDLKFNN
jgi:WD40 repeat protein